MRYTDHLIVESLRQRGAPILEEGNKLQRVTFSGKHISYVLVNPSEEAVSTSIDGPNSINLWMYVEADIRSDQVKSIQFVIEKISSFEVLYNLESSEKDPDGYPLIYEEEEEISESSWSTAVECDSIPCSIHDFELTLTIDYKTNKVVKLEVW